MAYFKKIYFNIALDWYILLKLCFGDEELFKNLYIKKENCKKKHITQDRNRAKTNFRTSTPLYLYDSLCVSLVIQIIPNCKMKVGYHYFIFH